MNQPAARWVSLSFHLWVSRCFTIPVFHHYFEAETASLTVDSMARTSAIGKIPAATLKMAEAVASWHLNEYKQIFAPPLQRTAQEHDADKVYSYLYRSLHLAGIGEVLKNQVLQYCSVRKGVRFDEALQVLQIRQAIGIARKKIGASKKESDVIMLNQQYFSSRPPY